MEEDDFFITKKYMIMKDLFSHLNKEIQEDDFDSFELVVMGIVAPLALIVFCGLVGFLLNF